MRDLPKGSIGVNIVNDFDPLYNIVPRDKRKIVSRIGEAARNAESVILANRSRPRGRSHRLASRVGAAGLDPAKVRRVTFHEITEEAIRDAMDHPTGIDMKLVDFASKARRILDRLVGFQISPLLSKGIPGANSAGRVQKRRPFDSWWTGSGRSRRSYRANGGRSARSFPSLQMTRASFQPTWSR